MASLDTSQLYWQFARMLREDLIRAFFEPIAGRKLSMKKVEATDVTLRRVVDFVREHKDIQKLLGLTKKRP